ncbi:MAG: hypothetical protein Q4A37_02705 [Candidatus Saccharibacteria bacterium]|nr:hypothetical protein [Candidatus Saccharibacteria bacterium]
MARQEAGSVSIFSVIFASLLLTVVTVSFIKLMMTDQQQATTNDLSQSAYDAALAGVEDAKRVIRACQQGQADACEALQKPHDCNVINRSLAVTGVPQNNETLIRSGHGQGAQYDQAYTCVNITMNTEDYLYKATVDKSQLILLRSKQDFNEVQLEWFSRDDTTALAATSPPSYDPATGQGALPRRAAWGAATPPLLRAHIITPGESFRLDELDATGRSVTAFLRPYVSSAATPPSPLSPNLSSHERATGDNEYDNNISLVTCHKNFSYNTYACRARLTIRPVSQQASQQALLRLTPLYNSASVRVSLYKDGAPVLFDGVQPSVDATGRAANVFRRVDARLQIGSDFPYPEHTVQTINSLCKTFSVTDGGVVADHGDCRLD